MGKHVTARKVAATSSTLTPRACLTVTNGCIWGHVVSGWPVPQSPTAPRIEGASCEEKDPHCPGSWSCNFPRLCFPPGRTEWKGCGGFRCFRLKSSLPLLGFPAARLPLLVSYSATQPRRPVGSSSSPLQGRRINPLRHLRHRKSPLKPCDSNPPEAFPPVERLPHAPVLWPRRDSGFGTWEGFLGFSLRTSKH